MSKYELRYNAENELYEIWKEDEDDILGKFGLMYSGNNNTRSWSKVSSHKSQREATAKLKRMKNKPSKVIKELTF
jgi:hypothetical protein